MPSVIHPRSGPFPVYSSTSPPTVDVGLFTIAKTGVNLKAAGTTTIFTVPASRSFKLTGAFITVTAVTSPGLGTQNMQIKESGASGVMSIAMTSSGQSPAVGTAFVVALNTNGSQPYIDCAAGNSVQAVITTSQAGSTAVTGTVYVTGFYTQ